MRPDAFEYGVKLALAAIAFAFYRDTRAGEGVSPELQRALVQVFGEAVALEAARRIADGRYDDELRDALDKLPPLPRMLQ